MLSRLGGRGYLVDEEKTDYRSSPIDFDPDFDFDPDQNNTQSGPRGLTE